MTSLRTGIVLLLMLVSLSVCSGKIRRANGITPSYNTITAEVAYQMMQERKDFIILDVRSIEEFSEKHITGAVLIPVQELERRAASELPDKNASIFIYCRSGARSINAANILVGLGYTHLYNFGGIQSWPYETVSIK